MRYEYVYNLQEPRARPKTAAVLTSKEWQKMKGKLEEVRLHQEEEEERVAIIKERKDRSLKMTKNWPNTMASVQKNRELRFAEAARLEEERKQKQYEDIIARRAQEKEEVLRKARELVYQSKESSRKLKSGLILSGVLEERKRQLALKQQLRERREEKEAKEAEAMWRLGDELEEFLEQEKRAAVQKKKATRKMLDEQMEEVIENHRQKLEEKQAEELDMEHLRKELAELAAEEAKEKLDIKSKLKQDQKDFQKLDNYCKERKRQLEQEQEEMNAIYNTVRDRLEMQRREKEREIREDLIIRRQKRAALTLKPPDYTKEEEIYETAQEESEKKYKEQQKITKEKKEKLRKELLQYQDEAEKAWEEAGRKRLEERRWDLLKRMALDEANKEWDNEEENRIEKNKMTVKEDLLRQWREKEENSLRTKLEEIKEFKMHTAEDHSLMIKQCFEVEEYVKANKWPLYPVTTAIQAAKKEAGLTEEKKDIVFLKSRVPIESVGIYQLQSTQ